MMYLDLLENMRGERGNIENKTGQMLFCLLGMGDFIILFSLL